MGGGGSSGRPTSTGAPGWAGETALAWRSLSRTISPGRTVGGQQLARQGERRAEVEPSRRDVQLVESRGERSRVASLRDAVGGEEPERVVRAWRAPAPAGPRRAAAPIRGDPPTTAPLLGELSTISTSALGAWPGTPRSGRVGTGGGEHQHDDQQRAHQEQQQVLQLETALVLAGGGDQVAHRGKDDGRRLAPGQQVEEDGNRRRGQPEQHPGMEEPDHPARGSGASASRSTCRTGCPS